MSELLHVSQISILSDDDRRTLDEARRWVRFIVLQTIPSKLPAMEDQEERFAFYFDGNERRGLSDLLGNLDAMAARTSGEPQLAKPGCDFCGDTANVRTLKNGSHICEDCHREIAATWSKEAVQ